MSKRIEIFSAGCPACREAIDLVQRIAGASGEIVIRDMNAPDVAAEAKARGVRSVPSVHVEGKAASCCADRGIDETAIRAALGSE